MSKVPQRRRGGDKRSSWLTFRRRMFAFRRLLQKPTKSQDLIDETKAFFGDEIIYGDDPRSAVRHDIQSLRKDFNCTIEHDRQQQYVLRDAGEWAIFDTQEDAEVLQHLLAVHTDATTPNGTPIRPFLQRVLHLFPKAQREQINRSGAQQRELGGSTEYEA